MFIVYHGYVTPDNCDASEGRGPYRLDVCETEEEVLKLREEHESEISSEDDRDGYGDVSNPVFRVFEGVELKVESKKKVTTWALKRPRR